jgi:hypothetical protein
MNIFFNLSLIINLNAIKSVAFAKFSSFGPGIKGLSVTVKSNPEDFIKLEDYSFKQQSTDLASG